MQELTERLQDRVPSVSQDTASLCATLVAHDVLVCERELHLIETLAAEQDVGDEHLDPVRARRLP